MKYQKLKISYSRKIFKSWNSINGFTLIEMLIAVLLSTILVIIIFEFFDYQQKNYNLQDQLTEMQQNLRVGMDALSRDLRMVGYGVPSVINPSAIVKITSATNNSITYLTNYSDVYSQLSGSYTGGTTLSVNSRNGFKGSDVIYITDGSKWAQTTISSSYTSATGAGPITISSALSNPSYVPGTTVHVVNTIIYTIDTTDKELTRNKDSTGADPVCNNVDYLQFKYYDKNNALLSNPVPYTGVNLNSTQRSDVKRIHILLVGRTSKIEKGYTCSGNYDTGIPYPSDSYHRTRLETDIMLRNLAD